MFTHHISLKGAPAGAYKKVKGALELILGDGKRFEYVKPAFRLRVNDDEVPLLEDLLANLSDEIAFKLVLEAVEPEVEESSKPAAIEEPPVKMEETPVKAEEPFEPTAVEEPPAPPVAVEPPKPLPAPPKPVVAPSAPSPRPPANPAFTKASAYLTTLQKQAPRPCTVTFDDGRSYVVTFGGPGRYAVTRTKPTLAFLGTASYIKALEAIRADLPK